MVSGPLKWPPDETPSQPAPQPAAEGELTESQIIQVSQALFADLAEVVNRYAPHLSRFNILGAITGLLLSAYKSSDPTEQKGGS